MLGGGKLQPASSTKAEEEATPSKSLLLNTPSSPSKGWYGRINREEAERNLNASPNGSSLLRFSEKENQFVLSLKDNKGEMKDYRLDSITNPATASLDEVWEAAANLNALTLPFLPVKGWFGCISGEEEQNRS